MFETPKMKYVKDLARDPWHAAAHRHYFLIHSVLLLTGMLLSPSIACALYLTPMALAWTMGGALNYVNHKWGYRSYATSDASTNNLLFGYLYWGEGWHNNHHYAPSKSCFGERWWEWDPCYWVIKFVCKQENQ